MAKYLFSLIAAIALVVICESTRYDGYKVYRVDFKTDEQFNMIYQMDLHPPKGIMFWQLSHMQHHADIMVAPEVAQSFLATLDSYGFTYRVIIEDVQRTVDNGN